MTFARACQIAGWAGAAALAVTALVARWRVAPLGLADGDTWGWLHPALSWVGGAGFHQEFEREWLYPAWIATLLKLTGSFEGVVRIQQFLGALSVLVAWFTWQRWVGFFPERKTTLVAAVLLGWLVMAWIALNPSTLALELSLRPESLVAFLGFAQWACITEFIRSRWLAANPLRAIAFGALSLPLAWALYILKPNWALAVPVSIAPLIVGLWGGSGLRRNLAPLALGAGAVIAFLVVPEKTLFLPSPLKPVVLPMTLLTIHAPSVERALTHEMESSPDRRDLLGAYLPIFREEIAEARSRWDRYPRLGFDPDYLMYRSRVFPTLTEEHGLSRDELIAFCKSSYLAAWRTDPGGMTSKVASQFAWFVFPAPEVFFRTKLKMTRIVANASHVLPRETRDGVDPAVLGVFRDYREALDRNAARTWDLRGPKALAVPARLFAAVTPLLLLALPIVALATLAWPRLQPLRPSAWTSLLFLATPAANALTIAIAHSLDNTRYQITYGPMLAFALAATLVTLVATGCELLARNR